MYALQDVWGWRQTPGLKKCQIASDLRKPIIHLYCGFRWVEWSEA
ncbi:hypothetical protein STBHUCCB_25930 [Salmonella enterica subsp. enterica serovar Typhi str. P-stx-12]|nr:hypothetical protein STBHUCCB_25930 [Salmonella enterica subsp. enterica serovar Typhi str. P-stx-12]AXR56513.1 hypothetical protein CJP42_3662 [Salmonella enterica subsp. enterica serovar Typhi]